MSKTLLLFPHQLFEEVIEESKKYDEVVLIEHPLFFGNDYKYPMAFHKQKMVLHRASMRAFADKIENSRYVDFDEPDVADLGFVAAGQDIFFYDVVDYELRKRLNKLESVTELPSPNFYLNRDQLSEYFSSDKKQRFNDFYIRRRREEEILLTSNGEAVGGKWSYDSENRKKLPKNHAVPEVSAVDQNDYITEAKKYVEQHFPGRIGSLETVIYPIDHSSSQAWFTQFLNERLPEFGPYEDAIEQEHTFMFHSVITPMLNIGLLDPKWVVAEILERHETHDIPLATIEGYVRQVLGWREYMRGLYEVQGVSMRTKNHFEFSAELTNSWYDATTGIEPLDDMISDLTKYAYSHHILRLMVAGNIMLMSRLHPDQVYTWFMEMFIDSYDWVMVPNVYGMSQYADGGNIVTKPYLAGSNYIHKMSSYKKSEWSETLDGLYWKFIEDHKSLFASNYRMKMMVSMVEKMDEEKKQRIFAAQERFISEHTSK